MILAPLFFEIIVRAVQPIRVGRAEDVVIMDRLIAQHLGRVWCVWVDEQAFARPDLDGLDVRVEPDAALKHMRNLLVLVGVFGHDASLFKFEPAEHLVHADDYLSAKSVRDLLGGHFVPTVFFGWYFFPLSPKPRFA
jgi:hypothetical protein